MDGNIGRKWDSSKDEGDEGEEEEKKSRVTRCVLGLRVRYHQVLKILSIYAHQRYAWHHMVTKQCHNKYTENS